MAGGAHHRPIMADRLNIIKLGERGLRNGFKRFAG
jgi:hypothetical protein